MATCCARNEKRHFFLSGCTQTYTKGEAKTYFCIFFFAFSSTPIHQRNWLDLEPKQHSHKDAQSFTISEKMIALLRHGTLLREKDGAVEFWRLKAEFTWSFPQSPHLSVQFCLHHMEIGGGHKKRFQFCTDSNTQEILHLRAIQGRSGENSVDPFLLDTVLIPDCFFDLHSSCRKRFQLTLHHSIRIDCWRSNSWQRSPNGILFSR